MKKHTISALAIAATLALGAPLALAGSCGSTAAHSHAKVSIAEVAQKEGFTTLLTAVKAAGLDETLANDGPFTVFAPTDEAFAKLPEGTLEALLADKAALKQVLLYHVVSGEVTSDAVVKLDEASTLEGESVKIDAKKGVKINDATVVQADVMANNGVIHVIDTVLIPKGLKL